MYVNLNREPAPRQGDSTSDDVQWSPAQRTGTATTNLSRLRATINEREPQRHDRNDPPVECSEATQPEFRGAPLRGPARAWRNGVSWPGGVSRHDAGRGGSAEASIALYPDPLLGQVLVASTYPLEIVQLQQWLAKNPGLKDKALADAVAKQPWDPSIQSMAALPDAVKRLGDDIQWTTSLGNAFLAQQSDVMDAVQRMRKKAEGTGALKTNEQQKVETKVIEQKTVIVVEPANPQVVYVPAYNPVVVYGPPVYAYPPIYYPPYYPPSTGAVVAASMISFGVGIAIGAAWGGGYGYGCGWGGNNINVNVNNNFNRNANINRGGNSNWSHNPQHRGAAPYSNQATANKYGGTTRGGGGARAGTQSGGGASRSAASGRSAGPTPSSQSSRAGGASGSGDRVGNRDVGSSRSSGGGAFGGSGGSGASARASSARGASSAGSRGGSRSGGGGGRRR